MIDSCYDYDMWQKKPKNERYGVNDYVVGKNKIWLVVLFLDMN